MHQQRSFSAFGFGAGEASRTGTLTSLSSQSRRGSQINVNVSPPQTSHANGDTPEIRKYKKRFGSDVLCASLWGKFGSSLTVCYVLQSNIAFRAILDK